MQINLTPAQRDWMSSRAVEVLLTLHRLKSESVDNDEVRERYVELMLMSAFHQGRAAANAEAVQRVLGWPMAAPDHKEQAA